MELAVKALDLLGAGSIFPVRDRSFYELWKAFEQELPASSLEQVLKRLSGETRWSIREAMFHGRELPAILPLRESEQLGQLAYVLALAHHVWGSWALVTRFFDSSPMDSRRPKQPERNLGRAR